jgi:hypothetical protein
MSRDRSILVWSKPNFWDHAYVLSQDGAQIAKFELRSIVGTRAGGECGGKRWLLERRGFFRLKVTVREEGSDHYVAVAESRWNGDQRIHTEKGDTFEWKRASFWGSAWACLDRDQIPILKIKLTYRFLSAPYEVIPVDLEKVTGHYPWLLILSIYLAILDNND